MYSPQMPMPSAAQYCISWVSYKNSIAKGFSRFQQNGEFVDMTLAAEGHLVKVHKNIVALASPYLKAMIQSTPCQHPVVFLNNLSQEMLSFILEYIYTGEVKIPTDATPTFIEACRALHISGVEHLYFPRKPEPESQPVYYDEVIARPTESLPPPDDNYAAHITINNDNYNVEVIPNENVAHQRTQPITTLDNDLMNYQVLTDATVAENRINYEQDSFEPIPLNNTEPDYEPPRTPLSDPEEYQSENLTIIDQNPTYQNQENISSDWNRKEIPLRTQSTDKPIQPRISDRDKSQHYSLSNRGSLQLLLNRYMYYCHHQSCGGTKRRWRCVDYRKLRCPAFIDTDNENITNRSEDHTHSNHDMKILRKFKSKKVFTSLSHAVDKVPERGPRVRIVKRL